MNKSIRNRYINFVKRFITRPTLLHQRVSTIYLSNIFFFSLLSSDFDKWRPEIRLLYAV